MTNQELKNTKIDEKNNFTINETWIDPNDVLNKPVYTRVVTNPKDPNFISKNLKTFLNQKNEYYPYLCNGKCLCGTCICGKCKCVHFKYKTENQDPFNYTTIYKQDYIPWDYQRSLPFKSSPEGVVFSLPKDYSTQYQAHFKKPNKLNGADDNLFPNIAKMTSIDPFARKLKAPMAKESSYKLDYPNWEANKMETIQPYVPNTRTNILPFFGKPSNKDYGDFYKEGINPQTQIFTNPDHKNNENPLGPNIPMDYNTKYGSDYPQYPKEILEPFEMQIPENNLNSYNQNFKNKYKPVSTDLGRQSRKINCPMRTQVEWVKQLLKNFAKENKIAYQYIISIIFLFFFLLIYFLIFIINFQ